MSRIAELKPGQRSEITLHHARDWVMAYHGAQEQYLNTFAGPHHFKDGPWPQDEAGWNASLPWPDVVDAWNSSIHNLTEHIISSHVDAVIASGESVRQLLLEDSRLGKKLTSQNILLIWLPKKIAYAVYNNAIIDKTYDARICGHQFEGYLKQHGGSVPRHAMFIDDVVRSSAKIDYATQTCVKAGIDIETATLAAPFTSDLVQFSGSVDRDFYAYVVNLTQSVHFLHSPVWHKRVIAQYPDYVAIARLNQLVHETAEALRRD